MSTSGLTGTPRGKIIYSAHGDVIFGEWVERMLEGDCQELGAHPQHGVPYHGIQDE